MTNDSPPTGQDPNAPPQVPPIQHQPYYTGTSPPPAQPEYTVPSGVIGLAPERKAYPETRTEKGLKYGMISFALVIFGTIVPICSSVVFIALILKLLGFFEIRNDRKNFGPEHAKSVETSTTLFIYWIVISIAIMIAAAMAMAPGISSIFSTVPGQELDMLPFARSFVGAMNVVMIISLVGSIIFAFARYYLIKCLQDRQGLSALQLTVSVAILISLISTVLGFMYLQGLEASLANATSMSSDDFDNWIASANSTMQIYNYITIIPELMFLWAYYLPYGRLKRGELKPMMQPPQWGQAPGPMPAGGYYNPRFPIQPQQWSQPGIPGQPPQPYGQPPTASYQHPTAQPLRPPPPVGVPAQTHDAGAPTLESVTCPSCQTTFGFDPSAEMMKCPGCGITGKIERKA